MSLRIALTVFTCTLFCAVSSAQNLLPTAEIEAFRLHCPKNLVVGVVHVIDSSVIQGYGSADIERALNSLPSVKMETRGDGGSRRLHVRGSSLRSPFSVRNSMLLKDGFVLTEADGNSPLEWIDPDLTSRISLISGPSAASYGGAYGGALIVTSSPLINKVTNGWIHSQTGTTGSYLGLHNRLSAGVKKGFKNGAISLGAIKVDNPGYRDWEWNNKTQIEVRGEFHGKLGGTHSILLANFDGSWALPGSIKQTQVDTLPTTSPGGNYNAHVARNRSIAGYKYNLKLENGWTTSISILGRITQKTNPYGTSPFYKGYKEESGSGYSVLASADKNIIDGEFWKLDFEVSVMHLSDEVKIKEWSSEEQLELRYDLIMQASQSFGSISYVASYLDKIRIEAQAGISYRDRLTSGVLFAQEETDYFYTYLSEKSHSTFLPRLGISYQILPSTVLFLQSSTGFSDPTAFELVDPETGQAADLESENSFGIESGFRTQLTSDLELKLTIYHQTVNNAILQVIKENDAVVFENVKGGLVMGGVEKEMIWQINEHLNFRSYGSLSLHYFGIDSDYAGNKLPGSPRTMGGVQVSTQHNWGRLSVNAKYVGETPLNNENSSYMDAYKIIDASTVITLPRNIFLELGMRNILNASYSDWPQLNGVYGKFYNPAPPRNAYLSLRWNIAKP